MITPRFFSISRPLRPQRARLIFARLLLRPHRAGPIFTRILLRPQGARTLPGAPRSKPLVPARFLPRPEGARTLVAHLTAFLLLLPSCSPAPRTSPAVLRSPAPTILSSEPWIFENTQGRLIRTASYRLFITEPDPDVRDMLPEFLERALTHYTTALTPEIPLPRPDLKLDTFLMADRAQWSSLTRQIMGAAAEPYLRIQRGGFSSGGRAFLFTIGHRDTLAIAAHEGWHQYTQRTFRHELPVWLEEGISAYVEGFIADPADPRLPLFRPWANPERFEQLAAAHAAGRLIPLPRLLDMSPAALLTSDTDSALTYYAQTWALVHYLADGGDGSLACLAALADTLHDAAQGRLRAAVDRRHGPGASQLLARERRGPEVFTTYFDPDLRRAALEYDAFVEAIVTGSKDRVVAGMRPF